MAERPILLDQILKSKNDPSLVPLLAYPRDATIADFELFTSHDLNELVNRAAIPYNRIGIDLVSVDLAKETHHLQKSVLSSRYKSPNTPS